MILCIIYKLVHQARSILVLLVSIILCITFKYVCANELVLSTS